MARLSPLFPRGAFDLRGRVQPLPTNGEVPAMPGWRWLHTPGHAPGHVSLFRDSDRVLIAGDAVTTTRQESMYAVLTQEQVLSGPPADFTIDWEKARASVARLAALEPRLIATGHGQPLRGDAASAELRALSADFTRRARPRHGRYVDQPALTDRHGVVALPAAPRSGGAGGACCRASRPPRSRAPG